MRCQRAPGGLCEHRSVASQTGPSCFGNTASSSRGKGRARALGRAAPGWRHACLGQSAGKHRAGGGRGRKASKGVPLVCRGTGIPAAYLVLMMLPERSRNKQTPALALRKTFSRSRPGSAGSERVPRRKAATRSTQRAGVRTWGVSAALRHVAQSGKPARAQLHWAKPAAESATGDTARAREPPWLERRRRVL